MSEKSLDYKNQYVGTINHFIAGSIQQYQQGLYYDAIQSLIPVLSYIIVPNDEIQEKLQTLISQIAKIDEIRETTGQTRDSNQWRTKTKKNKISKGLCPLVIREIATILRDLGYFTFDETGKFIDLTGGKRLE